MQKLNTVFPLFWAIEPDALPMALRLFAQVDQPQELAVTPSFKGSGNHKIAVVPVRGVLSKDGGWRGSGYDSISRAVSSAAADPDVKHIVLAVDSPGGEVSGAPETGAVIAAAAKVKPVTAMVDGRAGSAAYWLASQARNITVTPSGQVGSVGVLAAHADISKALDNEGVKVTELFSGNFKTEWSPYKPLSEDAKEHMQGRINTMHDDFLSAVASGRGSRPSQDIAEQRFGEGRMFPAADAVKHGLADNIQSASEFFQSITPPQDEPTHFGFRAETARRRVELERARI